MNIRKCLTFFCAQLNVQMGWIHSACVSWKTHFHFQSCCCPLLKHHKTPALGMSHPLWIKMCPVCCVFMSVIYCIITDCWSWFCRFRGWEKAQWITLSVLCNTCRGPQRRANDWIILNLRSTCPPCGSCRAWNCALWSFSLLMWHHRNNFVSVESSWYVLICYFAWRIGLVELNQNSNVLHSTGADFVQIRVKETCKSARSRCWKGPVASVNALQRREKYEPIQTCEESEAGAFEVMF